MLKVALTGNIASGKSTVARAWTALGARVIDADLLARRAVEPGSPALAAIARRWGREVLDADGRLARAALRERVFADEAARRELEAIVHPEVARLRDEEYRRVERSGADIVVADIPLLFEVGLESEFDLVVLVDAPEEVRRERLVRDRGLSPESADRMIAAQIPSSEKRARADRVIDNDGSVAELQARAEAVWGEIVEMASQGRAE